MTLKDCITKFETTGPCAIDVALAIKYFTKRCFISKWNNEYRLCRIIYKQILAVRIDISSEDAQEIIDTMGLVEHDSGIFFSGSTFLMKDVNPRRI
jgi:hypothetical protein